MLARTMRGFAFWGMTSLVISLFTSTARAISIDPIPPTKNHSQTVSGGIDPGAVVSVLCPGAVVGEVTYLTEARWSVPVTGLSEGSTQVTASANIGTPATVTADIVVDTVAPVLNVSALENGTITNNPILNIFGTALDGTGSGLAGVSVNSSSVILSADGNFSYALPLSPGANSITIIATDLAGNSTQDTRAVTLDPLAPQVAITAPADNMATGQSPVTVTGVVGANSLVAMSVNGAVAQPVPVLGGGFSADATLAPGLNTVAISVTDQQTHSVAAKRTIVYDPAKVSLQIQDPTQDTVTNQSSYKIKGTVSDTVGSVTVAVDGIASAPPVTNGAFEQVVEFGANKNYQVTATANGTLEGATSVVRNIIYDSVAPTITSASSSTASGHYGAGRSINVTLSFSEPVFSPGLTISLNSQGSISSGALSGVSSFSATYTVAAGQNADLLEVSSVTGTLTDFAGNQSSNPSVPDGSNIGDAVTIAVDTTAPIASIGNHPTDPTRFRDGSISFSLDEPGTTECRLEGGGFGNCASPFGFAGLADGPHTFSVRGTDLAGNTGSAQTYSWTTDTGAPTVNAGKDQVSNKLFTQTATATDATTLAFQWSKQSGPGTITFGSPSALVTTISASTDGPYLLRLTATDAAGNSAFSEMTLIWDTTVPSVGAGGNKTVNAAFTQTATATDATALTYQWSKQSGPGTITFGSPTALVTTISASLEGSYLLRLTATDAAGNNAFSEMTLTWDTTAPSVGAGGNKIAHAAFTQTATASDATALTFQWTQQSGPGTITFGSPTALVTTISASLEGSYLLRLTATDAAGNNAFSEMTLTWDTTAPSVGAGGNKTANAVFTQTATASDATALTYQWSKQSGPGTITFGSPSALVTTISASTDGSYLLRLTATDAAGNGASSDMTLTWDTTAPSVGAGGNKTVNAAFTQTGTATDATALTYQWSKQSGPGNITFGSPTALVTTISASLEGSYLLRLTATDAAGNSAFSEMTLTWDTTAPSVGAGGNKIAHAAFTQTATASDATALTFQWTQQSGPGNITFGSPTALVTTISASLEGSYLLRLTATDAAGNSAFSEMTLTWDTTAPSVGAGGNKTVNAAFTQNATASDATALTFQWTQQSGPGTITFGSPTALVTTISASANGSYLLRLTARDAAGNSASSDMTLTWDTTAPSVGAGGNKTANSVFTQTATATDATALTYQWSKQSGPGNISFGSPTALVTTISASLDGSYLLRLTATDAAGNSAFSDMTLTWDTAAPSVNAGGNKTVNAMFTQTATASDVTALTLQWSKQSGPGVITFGSPSALVTTITASADGAYLLRLTATDAAGNSASSDMTLIWDTTAPTVSAGSNKTVNAAFTQIATASDATALSYQWLQWSGPGSITFGSPASLVTTVSASADGTYRLRLIATDGAGNSASSDMTLTWDTAAPSISAGGNKTANTVFTQTATASDVTALAFQWTMQSGPGVVTFGSSTALVTTISASLDGSYLLRLTATDAAGNSASSDMTLTWDTTAPSVSAGGNKTVNAPFTPTASATDATALTYQWSQQSGPGKISFGSPEALLTTISASLDGSYLLRLTATDAAGNSAFNDMTLTWDTTAPAISAGGNKTARAGFTPLATASDATALSFQWAQQTGPGSISFGSPTELVTTISASADGSYLLRLAATDAAGNSAFSDMTLTWDTTAPTVNAGGNRAANATYTQMATASDATALTYQWTKQSGPGAITFGSPNALATNITANTDASYVLRLTATDAAGNSSYDEMTLVWDTVSPFITAGSSGAHNGPFTQVATSNEQSVSFLWSVKSGPGSVSFGSPASAATTVAADTEGTYVLHVTGSDASGNSSSSEATVVWDRSVPVLAVATLPNNSYTRNAVLTISGSVTDALSGIGRFTINDADLPLDANGVFSYDLALSDGANVITISASDRAGNTSNEVRTIFLDQAPPVLTIDTPGNNLKTNLSSVKVAGTVDKQCKITVNVTGDGPQRSFEVQAAGGIYALQIDSLSVGPNTVEVVAVSNAGLETRKSVTLTYDDQKPLLDVASPLGVVRAAGDSITVSGTASDAHTGVSVTITTGTGTFNPALVNGSFSQEIPLNEEMVYLITVTAQNETGTTSVIERQVLHAKLTGDIDGDRAVGLNDALVALKMSIGVVPQEARYLLRGDIGPLKNGVPAPDGKIDISDVALILRLIVGTFTLK